MDDGFTSPQPDHTAAEPAPLSEDESKRLTELRAKYDRTEDETAEMELLGEQESAAAGHVVAPAPASLGPMEHMVAAMEQYGAMFAHLVEVVPGAAPLRPMVEGAKLRLQAMRREISEAVNRL